MTCSEWRAEGLCVSFLEGGPLTCTVPGGGGAALCSLGAPNAPGLLVGAPAIRSFIGTSTTLLLLVVAPSLLVALATRTGCTVVPSTDLVVVLSRPAVLSSPSP